jgi:hypothetical protein
MGHYGNAQMPLRLTNATLMLDIGTEWTLNASLTRLSSYRKCSRRRILGHSAQATSLLPIEGMTKCSRIARGFGSGNSMGFAAEVNPKAGFEFRASAAFVVSKPIAMLTFRAGVAPADVQLLPRCTFSTTDRRADRFGLICSCHDRICLLAQI